MFESCLEKQKAIIEMFSECRSEEAKYEKIILLGRQLKLFDAQHKTNDNLVAGCQSQVFLYAYWMDDVVMFEVESDALISAGLAALLIIVYSGEKPEVILKCPPTYLEDIGINRSLTPNRASGLYNIHLRMKQEALKMLVEREKSTLPN